MGVPEPRPPAAPLAPALCRVIAHRDPAALARLRPTWEGLLARLPAASVFTAPPWALAWWQTYGAHRELWLLEIRAGERGAGLAPLQGGRGRGAGPGPRPPGGGPAHRAPRAPRAPRH